MSRFHFVHHKSHVNWLGVEIRPVMCEEPTNHPRYVGLNVFGMIQKTRGHYFPKSHRPDQLVSVREKVLHL
jgi:hypothetical protein